jgi:hypothetical protein
VTLMPRANPSDAGVCAKATFGSTTLEAPRPARRN